MLHSIAQRRSLDTRRQQARVCITAVLLVCALLCVYPVRAADDWTSQSTQLLQRLLNINPALLLELDRPDLNTFYSERDYRPIWSDASGLLPRAVELVDTLRQAGDEGLDPDEYFLEDIDKLLDADAPGELIELELWLTAALYRYSHDVYSGRLDPYMLDADWHIPNSRLDSRRLLEQIAQADSIQSLLSGLLPGQDAYKQLRQQLQRYREIAAAGGWGSIDSWPRLEAGVRHHEVLRLRNRLALTGDLSTAVSAGGDVFDNKLKQALKRFQRRHGLQATGRVDNKTLRSLNVDVHERIAQIRLNMERWRWLPRDLGTRYIAVNMTGFELLLMRNGEQELTMPVVIGKPFTETPALSGVISSLVYNPYWTIPKRVMWEKFIPGQMKDQDYLTKRSIRLFKGWADPVEVEPASVDWSNPDPNNFPYWMRQDPGPGNALGRIKFLFSNPYRIYLHGSPEKHLFNRTVRTYSQGCIRVKDPEELAVFLQGNTGTELRNKVKAKVSSGKNEKVYLQSTVPVYLLYWTAWMDNDGVLHFRDDIYDRDGKLRNRLERLNQVADSSEADVDT